MTDRVFVWMVGLLWFSLPYSAGTVVGELTDGRSDGVQTVAAVLVWSAWATGLVSVLVPHTITLTWLRVVAPGAFAIALWGVIVGDARTALAVSALVVTGAVAVATLSAPFGAVCVNGTSYGDEVRLPLRPPGRLLLGPIPVAWAVTVCGLAAGPLALGAHRWIAGGILTVVGVMAAAGALRALHGLSRRWLVFVPAGLVIHDTTALVDPQLFRRPDIAHLGPALADTTATDLTLDAPGLALELGLRGVTPVVRRPSRGTPTDQTEQATAVLVAPSRPGYVLAEADRRRLPVG